MTDWRSVRQRFEEGDSTLQQLGEEFGVTPATISRHAKKENWRQKGGTVINLVAATGRLSQTVLAALGDEKQFYRYVLTEKSGGDSVTEERIFQKIDIKAVKEMTAILRELSQINSALRDGRELPEDATFRVVLEGETQDWSE
jgi:predicted transcriptional regulator